MKNKPKINLVNNANVSLNTMLYSANHDETIIMLHGGPGVPDEMIEVVDKLRDKFRIISIEQRGVGASVCKDCKFTMEDYISDIDAIADYYNLDQFHLFGHSWGGLYAQIYANARPQKIKSLFLCSPSSGTNTLWKKTQKEVMEFNKKLCSKKEWLSMGWNSLLGMLGSDKAYRKVFKQVILNYHSGYKKVSVEAEFLNKIYSTPINKTILEIKKYKPLSVFKQTELPICITYGDNDIYGNSKEELIKRFPMAKVVEIKKCGHIPWKNNPLAFESVLDEFYSRLKI